jgi:hypothetical protein
MNDLAHQMFFGGELFVFFVFCDVQMNKARRENREYNGHNPADYGYAYAFRSVHLAALSLDAVRRTPSSMAGEAGVRRAILSPEI